MAAPSNGLHPRRLVGAALGAVVLALGLSSCTSVIGQTQPTQLSLFCLVQHGDSRGSVYALVGQPTVAGSASRVAPVLFRAWQIPNDLSAPETWAAWQGKVSYLAIFNRGLLVRIDRRFGPHTQANWAC